MYGSTSLALRGDGCQISRKKTLRNTWMTPNKLNKNHWHQKYGLKKYETILNMWNSKKTEFVESETVKNGISKSWNGIYTILKRKNRGSMYVVIITVFEWINKINIPRLECSCRYNDNLVIVRPVVDMDWKCSYALELSCQRSVQKHGFVCQDACLVLSYFCLRNLVFGIAQWT